MELKTTIERDDVYSHRAKKDISEKHDKILGELFFSLAKAKGDGIATDHSPSDSVCRTLDIYQVQQLTQVHCGRLYSQADILDALKDLEQPKMTINRNNGVTHTYSDFNGKQIGAIRLDYSQPAKTDELAEDLAQIDLGDALADEIDKYDASRRWMEQQDTIQSLRSVIVDMAETLHVADPNARISMSSGDLLDLIHSQKDMPNNPF